MYPGSSNWGGGVGHFVYPYSFQGLNCSETMQRKLPNTCLLPSVCPLCLENSELLVHLFIFCPFSSNCWFSIFSMLKSVWVFDGSFSANVRQLLRGPYLSKKHFLIWVNLIKSDSS